MRKIISIVALFYCFIVIFASSVDAFEFFKSESNPLNISFINDYAYYLQAHIYKESDICKGILTARKPTDSYFSLAAIESSDCINWTMTKEVLNTGQELSNARLFIDDNGNKKIFFTKNEGNDFYQIYSTDCDNDLNCSSNIKLILNANQSDASEKNGYFASYVIKIDNQYYMFYGVWGGDGFKISLAYSDNLETWQKCPDDIVSSGADGPFPLLKDNNLYLFYHESDSSGIKLAKTSLPLGCTSVFVDLGYQLTPSQPYDAKHLIFPSVISDETMKIYYTGLGSNNGWRLNVACSEQKCLFTTPTPTVVPTATSIPVPTKIPIVFIPGFMASWNKEAILHNQSVNQSEWKLGSYVKEYQGLINTLKNLGFEENKDFFIFAYDWRKPILEIVEDLNSFINQFSISDSQFSIIGHSLGGLTARIYQQKYQNDNLKKLITVGSPHSGVVQVYKPLETGELDRENTFLWLAEKLVLFLNKIEIESDKETIRKRFPVAFDVFPIFNFLKDESGQEIPVENLSIKNNLLTNYNQSFDEVYGIFTSIYGEKDNNTLAGFVVDADGKPKDSYFEDGDYLVLKKSAKQDEDAEGLVFDHGEIIYKKEAIKKILSLLDIEFGEDQIVEGEKTNIGHSLIFLIRSPATMTVEFDNSIYIEDEGMIFIPDAKSGDYKLNVQGTDLGKYEIVIGKISESDDVWEKINGEIIDASPSSQIDSYLISYNNQSTVIPTATPTSTPSLTPTVIPSPTPTPTSTPILLSTNSSSSNSSNANQSIQSTTNEVPISKEPMSSVLGVSTEKEDSISPTIAERKQTEIKEIKKILVWDYIWPSIASILLAGTGWFFRKKLFRK